MKSGRKTLPLIIAFSILGLGSKMVDPELRRGVKSTTLGVRNIDNTPELELIEYEAKPPTPDSHGRYDKLDIEDPLRKVNYLRIHRISKERTSNTTRYDPAMGYFASPVKTFQWYGNAAETYGIRDVTRDNIPDIVLKYEKDKNGKKPEGGIVTFCQVRKKLEYLEIKKVRVVDPGKFAFDPSDIYDHDDPSHSPVHWR